MLAQGQQVSDTPLQGCGSGSKGAVPTGCRVSGSLESRPVAVRMQWGCRWRQGLGGQGSRRSGLEEWDLLLACWADCRGAPGLTAVERGS